MKTRSMIIEIVPGDLPPMEWDEGPSSKKRRKRHKASMTPFRTKIVRLEYLVHSDDAIVRVADAIDKRYSAYGALVVRRGNLIRVKTCLSSVRKTECTVRRIVKRYKDQPVKSPRSPLEWLKQYGRVGKYRKQRQAG